jgi:hypothetical protein
MKTTLIVLTFMAGSLTSTPTPNAGQSQEVHHLAYAETCHMKNMKNVRPAVAT